MPNAHSMQILLQKLFAKKDREKTALDAEPSLETQVSLKSLLVYLMCAVARLLY